MAFQPSLQRLRHQPPALDVFPTLQRFAAQRYSPFQPRSAKIPPGSSDAYPRKIRAKTLQNLYHDLGVMAFAGTTDHQTQKIAKILGRATWRKGGLPSLEGALCDEHDKYTVYKITSEDVVLGEDPRSPEGLVVTDELYRLAKFVGSQFCSDAITNLEDPNKAFPQLDFKLDYLTIREKQEARGLFHPTVNGPRRLPINAFIFARPALQHLELDISFYTVGTCSYLGSVNLGLKVYHTPEETGQVTRLKNTSIVSLVKELPFWPVSLAKDLRAVTTRTWQLERQVWAERWKKGQGDDSQNELNALTETLKESMLTMRDLKRKIKEIDEKRAEILGRKDKVLKKNPERVRKEKAEKAVKKQVEAQWAQPASDPEVVQKEELQTRIKV